MRRTLSIAIIIFLILSLSCFRCANWTKNQHFKSDSIHFVEDSMLLQSVLQQEDSLYHIKQLDSIRYDNGINNLSSKHPVLSLTFNENLHVTKIVFNDDNGQILGYIDSEMNPYDHIDLRHTNSYLIDEKIDQFPLPHFTEKGDLTAIISSFKNEIIDSIGKDGHLIYMPLPNINYRTILRSIFGSVLYIDNDSILAIRLNDVGTIEGIYYINGESVEASYPLFVLRKVRKKLQHIAMEEHARKK